MAKTSTRKGLWLPAPGQSADDRPAPRYRCVTCHQVITKGLVAVLSAVDNLGEAEALCVTCQPAWPMGLRPEHLP